jgi:hypothetical protein
MGRRHRLVLALAGLLHLAPLLWGLGGHPGWGLWVFAGLFAAWSLLYDRGGWRAGTALPRVLLLLALAALLLWAGRGLATLTGPWPLPRWLPPALGAGGLLAALTLMPPARARAMDAFLDEALAALRAMPVPEQDDRQGEAARALAQRIAALPAGAGEEAVAAALGPPSLLDAAFLDAVARRRPEDTPRPLRLAAVLAATDPRRGLEGRGEAAWVFDLARGDAGLEALFAERALALLDTAPRQWRDLPLSFDLDEAAGRSDSPAAARALARLRDRLRALSEGEEAG